MSGSISVNGSTSLGVITSPPSFSFDVTSNKSTGVNYYLDGTSYWIGGQAISFDEWDGGTTTISWSISQSTWDNIEDGKHTLYIKGINGENTASITFIKNNINTPDPLPPSYDPPSYNPPSYDPPAWNYPHSPDTIPPSSYPDFKDNEVVKMGVLQRTRIDKSTQLRGSIKILQKTSYESGRSINHESRSLCIYPRYRNGFIFSQTGEEFEDQITFVDTDIESEKWTWIKTTLNDKTVFISTTCAMDEYLFPLSDINVTLLGQNFKLRCLTVTEWQSINSSLLDKIDFGNKRINSNTYSIYYTVTRQDTNDKDYSFLSLYNDDEYDKWINNASNYSNKTFTAMSYVSKAKNEIVNWDVGWKYRTIKYNFIASDIRWIPVLELTNTSPSIVLPDKDKEDKVIHL